MVQGETSLIVASTEAQGWNYNQVSCISWKAGDTDYLKMSDFCLHPVQSSRLKWQGLMDQFIEDGGELGHEFTSTDELKNK
jgi:hypothetical protein